MTETEFDNGYWYATELLGFAIELGIPSAGKLRKDELEKVGTPDVEKGLTLDTPIANYTLPRPSALRAHAHRAHLHRARRALDRKSRVRPPRKP